MTELPDNSSPVDAIGPGTRLREWEIVDFRGRGSYGVVFEARRSSWLDAPHRAVKVFDPMVSAAARGALVGEFAALTELRHPHLLEGVDAFDLAEGTYAGCVVFVLELAEEDLATWAARAGRPEPADVAAVGAEVAAGLAALHGHGRVHGDVKPENILRSGDRWVLGDFGVTGLLEGSYAVTPGATIDYRPPELADAPPGGRLHRSTDVWALGVTLHVAATGRHPYPGPDPMLRYAAVVRDERADVPTLDPALGALLDRACLTRDPRARASAVDLADDLAALAADLQGGGGEPGAVVAGPDGGPLIATATEGPVAGDPAASRTGSTEPTGRTEAGSGPAAPTAPAPGRSPTATGPGGAPTVDAADPGTVPAPAAPVAPAAPTAHPDAPGTVPAGPPPAAAGAGVQPGEPAGALTAPGSGDVPPMAGGRGPGPVASGDAWLSSTAADPAHGQRSPVRGESAGSPTSTLVAAAGVAAVLAVVVAQVVGQVAAVPDVGLGVQRGLYVVVSLVVLVVAVEAGGRWWGSRRGAGWWSRSRPLVGAAAGVVWLAATAVVFGLL